MRNHVKVKVQRYTSPGSTLYGKRYKVRLRWTRWGNNLHLPEAQNEMYGSTSSSNDTGRDGASDGILRRTNVKSRRLSGDASIQASGTRGPSFKAQSNTYLGPDRTRDGTGDSCSSDNNNITLRKELNLISGTAVVAGLMIGSGIFITPSSILHYTQSFGLTMVLWVAGGVVALFGGLCFCELAALVKKSGSTYAFILEGYSFRRKNRWLTMLGSLLGFLSIWINALIGQPTGVAVALLTFGRYICRPFFIECSNVPMTPVKMLAFSALSK